MQISNAFQTAFPFPKRCLAKLIVLGVVLAGWAAPARAQIDTDASNNTAAGADALSLIPGAAMSNLAQLAAPGNDVDFFSVPLESNDVLLGMITPLKDLPVSYSLPDTVTSVMQNGIQLTYSDDDQADELPFFGEVRGSLFRFMSSSANTHHVGISGYRDWEFDGTATGQGHGQTGAYALTVARINPTVIGGGFVDTDPANNVIAGADSVLIGPSGASVAVSDLLVNDVDCYALNLSRGQVLSVLTAPVADLPFTFDVPDTLIQLLDSNGMPLVTNDDAGDAGNSDLDIDLNSDNPAIVDPNGIWGSAIRALIPADGLYYLRVTGYGDVDFEGDHTEAGRYALLLGAVTPPATLPGDFDNNGTVDAADYVRWRKFLGSAYTPADYDIWRANFGNPPGGSSAQSGTVPEPGPAALIAVLGLVVSVHRRGWARRPLADFGKLSPGRPVALGRCPFSAC